MKQYTEAERRKPMDDAINAYNERNKDAALEPKWASYRVKDIEKLKDEFEQAKIRNIFLKNQLFKLGQAVDTLTGNKKGESDHE